MNTFIYGVFPNTDALAPALAGLKALGLNDVAILQNQLHTAYHSADLKARLIGAGAIGAIMGGIAGLVALPAIQMHGGVFQVLTPVMTMVSGAVVCAYFAVWICGFLNWVDRPVLEHEVFEAHIPNGALLLGVTVGDTMQKLATIQCLDAAGAVELIARSASLGQLETLSAIENSTTSEVPINAPGLVA